MQEAIVKYCSSEGQDLVAVVTNKQSIYVYSLAEMRVKFFERQQKVDKENMGVIKQSLDPL